jgi:hypothetical protein
VATPELSTEESEKHEMERIEDLNRTAKALLDRAVERLSIETANWRRARRLGTDAKNIVSAALAVLERI